MAIEKVTSADLIEVTENGAVQVRTKTAIMEDGQQISGSFHRHVIVPGQDYANEDPRVQAICSATHTPEVIAAYQASLPPITE
jgi:archaellum component FlaF (FlaF/FlaG flagellin family)